ncbi:MAG: thiolase family protein [Hylemonella sp.]
MYRHRTPDEAVAVVGVGNTRYGLMPEYDAYDLGVIALRQALDDAQLTMDQIDGLILNRVPDYQRFAEICGINPQYTLTTPGHGRFAGICVQTAVAVLQAGLATTVALVYGNNGKSAGQRYGGDTDTYGSGGAGFWFPYGMTSPGAFHALMMQSHMQRYGTRPEQLAEIPMAFRYHASLNPQAVMREVFDLEGYLQARYICEPLRLLDYCLINDGGVALILTTRDRARDLPQKPVYVRAMAQRSQFVESTFPPEDFWHGRMNEAANETFARLDVKQEDMDALMIYDNFSPTVLFSLEGFGYCQPGEGGAFIEGGRLRLGAQFPTNTSGGHLSESYMQGWALQLEAVRQIRGTCGPRQVPSARHVHFMAAAPVLTSIVYGDQP